MIFAKNHDIIDDIEFQIIIHVGTNKIFRMVKLTMNKKPIRKIRYRKAILAMTDIFILIVAALTANFILALFNYRISHEDELMALVLGTICCFSSLVIIGAYSKPWKSIGFKDYLLCAIAVLIGDIITYLFLYVTRDELHLLYAATYCLVSMIGICAFRYIFKGIFISILSIGRNESARKRTLIIGGGRACKMILNEIKNAHKDGRMNDNPSADFEPVCIVDDDTSKRNTLIKGVPVVGSCNQIHDVVDAYKIEQIIFAIPSCTDEEKQRILDKCSSTTVPVKIIPFLGQLMFNSNESTLINQIRDIKIEDLLGRDPIKFDNAHVKTLVHNKVCLVTGGGGSIGSELVRQIAKYSPETLIIVDIYENNAYEIQQELKMEYGDTLNLVTLVASVRDYFRINQIFERYKPQIVFHAAAHKHVPLMEHSPMEAIKNNVIGTFNIATLAQFHETEKFVMISTDKAVNPTNTMGASKRCCEMIVQYLSQQKNGKTEFVTTRFGNVLGSNGSVIPLFKKQIEQGKTVTVTHPDIIRYFMTIPEAVSLVLEAAAIAHGGEIFVLDMGQPVRIVTLAENLIRMYGKVPYKDVKIEFTGLRPGEKIKEELLMNEEGLKKTDNELIFIGNQIEIDSDQFILQLRHLKYAAQENDEAAAIQALHEIVPTFITPEEFNTKAMAKL